MVVEQLRNTDPAFQTFQPWEFIPGEDTPWFFERSRYAKWPTDVSVSIWGGSWRMLLPLMRRPGVTEILIGGPDQVYAETKDGLIKTALNFDPSLPLPSGWNPTWRRPTAEDLAGGLGHIHRALAQREIWRPGAQLSDVHVEGNLEDRSRLMGLMPPVTTIGQVMLNIRRFAPVKFERADFVAMKSFTAEAGDVLDMAMQAGANTVFAAGTGTGKTTLLEHVAASIPANQVPLTIEDTPELNINHPLIRGMRTRERPGGAPDTFQDFSFTDALRASLRARPDWIIAGEIRDASDPSKSPADAFVNAIQSGHAGMCTLHAHDPYGAMMRLEAMLRAARPSMKDESLRLTIGESIRLIVVLHRLKVETFDAQGHPVTKILRRVDRISEVLGSDGQNYHLHPLFKTRFRPVRHPEAEGCPETMEPFLDMVGLPFFGLELEDKGMPLPAWWMDAKLNFLAAIPNIGRVAHNPELLRPTG